MKLNTEDMSEVVLSLADIVKAFEEILQKFAGRVIMNIHVKIWDVEAADRKIEQIAGLIEKYDCVGHVYFMSSNTQALLQMRERLPYASYCQGAGGGNDIMVEKAIENYLHRTGGAAPP